MLSSPTRSGRALSAWLLAGALAALGGACGDSGLPAPPASPVGDADAGALCPDGMRRDGAVCVEIAAASCAPGTAPFAGEEACAPIGPECAAALFDRDPSGWGCVDRPAPAACAGATREEVGSARCVPLGDCAAPFPPAGAIVVDDDFADNQLDATHFRSIAAAVAQAPSGAVIAVEAGDYAESVTVTQPVTIAGRCPERVNIRGAAGAAGIRVSTTSGVSVRGVTLTGHERGIDLLRGADVTLEDLHVTASVGSGVFVDASTANLRRVKISDTRTLADGKWGWGLAAGAGSKVTADGVAIVGGVVGAFAASDGTLVTLSESVVARQAPSGAVSRASGMIAVAGARIDLKRSVVRDLAADGAVVADEGTVEVSESVLRDVRVEGSMARGHGAVALAGSRVVLLGTTVSRAESVGLSSQQKGARIEARGVVVRGPVKSSARVDAQLRLASERAGMGLQVIEGAALSLDGAAVVDAWGFAMYVQSGGALDAKRTYVDGVRVLKTPEDLGFGVGVTVNGETSTAKLERFTVTRGSLAALSAGNRGSIEGDRVLLRDVGEADAVGTGAGLSVGNGGRAKLDRSAIIGAAGVGVLAVNRGSSAVTVTRSVVRGTRIARLGFGHALTIGPETSARVESSFILGNGATGLAVAGGSAWLSGVTFGTNPVALHVQDGSFLVESDGAEALGAGEVRVSPDTAFTENGTRVGSGVVALPRAVLE